jgi:putative aldouronate transport system substrate-binding protein
LLLTYGAPESDYSLDSDGRPMPADRSKMDAGAMNWKYIVQHPQVMHWPGIPGFAQAEYGFEKAAIPVGITDPTLGYVSATFQTKGVPLTQAFLDALGDVLQGRRPLADFDQIVKDWQTNGGEQIRKEYQESIAAAS